MLGIVLGFDVSGLASVFRVFFHVVGSRRGSAWDLTTQLVWALIWDERFMVQRPCETRPHAFARSGLAVVGIRCWHVWSRVFLFEV